MKIPSLLALATALLASGTHAQTYYVSTTGADANDGLSQATGWRHIAYASQQAMPGTTIFVESGAYDGENVAFPVDGTAAAPIRLEGFRLVPGDVAGHDFHYGDTLDAAKMPLLDGHDRTQGTAIDVVNRRFVQVKNLQIRNYEAGVDGWHGQDLLIEDVVAVGLGDIQAEYSGAGITMSYNSGSTVSHCFVLNSAAEGISITGDGNRLERSAVYGDDNSTLYKSATDYYIHLSGNHNVVADCYAERVGNLDHIGHGIGLKGDCQDNLFARNTAKNLGGGFYVRHRGCKNNTFVDCTVLGGDGLLVRDGASLNTFERCHTIGAEVGAIFLDTDEDGGAHFAGRDNVFVNCTFEDSRLAAIDFDSYSLASPVDHNRFVNCTIVGAPALFQSDRPNSANELVNCIVTDVPVLSIGAYPLVFTAAYCDFWATGFPTPAGPGMLSLDPLFVDADGQDNDPTTGDDNDLHLTALSPCLDAGDPASAPSSDNEGDPRPGLGDVGIADIGADEFSSRFYYVGPTAPGSSGLLRFLDYPGTAIGAWAVSFGLNEPPLPTVFGPLYLAFPWIPFGAAGATDASGQWSLPLTIPLGLTGAAYLQALVDLPARLTPLATLDLD
jgi:hypothetical protein